MNQNGPVVVDGATGYVGNHLVKALVDAQIPVRCLVRKQSHAQDRSFLADLGAEVVEANFAGSVDDLAKVLAGASCVVHLIGSIAPPKGENLESLHVKQTAAMVKALKMAGVARMVMVTALGAAPDAVSEYHRTKWHAEEQVRTGLENFVILRPSLIVGRQVGRRDSKLIARYRKLIGERPTVPMIEGGKNLMQPVFIGDLSKALVKAVSGEGTGQTVEIGGPEVLPMKEVVVCLMKVMQTQKKIVSLPAGAMSIVAGILEVVQQVPLVSRDQVKLAQTNNVCSSNGLESVFGVKPTPLSQALQSYAAGASTAATARA